MSTIPGGLVDKLYWRQVDGLWHCFEKYRGGYESLCGKHRRRRSGGQECLRPEPLLRCGRCDGEEMSIRGWDESGPASPIRPDVTAETRFLDALKRYRLSFVDEEELQFGVETMLDEEGIPFERETALAPRDRPDFLLGPVAVECKTAGSSLEVLRQLQRYASHSRIERLILLTTRSVHALELPAFVLKKPLRILYLPSL
jgi:hypothetical protein